jgi:hypothetical protein
MSVRSVVYFRYRIGYRMSITTPNGRPWYLLQEALIQTQVTVVTKWSTKISEQCWSREALNITGYYGVTINEIDTFNVVLKRNY